MITLLKFICVINIIFYLYTAIKNNYWILIVLIGAFANIILSIIGIESGRSPFMLCCCIVTMVLMFRRKKLYLNNIKLGSLACIVVFFFFYMLSYLYSPAAYTEYGIWKLKQLVILAFLPSILIVLSNNIKTVEINKIEDFILRSGILISYISLLSYIFGAGISADAEWFVRLDIGGANPIWIARYLSIVLLVIHSPRFKEKYTFVYFNTILILITCVLTGSKTILFFTCPILLIYKVINGTLSRQLIKQIMGLACIIGGIFLFIRKFNYIALIRRFSLQSNTIDERIQMISTTLNMFFEGNVFSFLFGNGGATIGESLGYGYIRQYPHNILVEVLYELGIFGTLLIVSFFVFVLILSIKKEQSWMIFSFYLYYLFTMTSGDLVSNYMLFIHFAFVISTYNMSTDMSG